MRAEQSGYEAGPGRDPPDDACVRWRAESLCGHSKALDRYEPPPRRHGYLPARRLQLGHLRHARGAHRTGAHSSAPRVFTCELQLTHEAMQPSSLRVVVAGDGGAPRLHCLLRQPTAYGPSAVYRAEC